MYIAKRKQTHRCRKGTGGYQHGGGKWEGQYRGMEVRDTHYYV